MLKWKTFWGANLFRRQSALNEQAIVLWRQGRLREAELLLRKTIETFPDYAPAYGNLGMVLFNENRFDESLNVLKKGISLSPSHAGLHVNLAIVLQKAGLHTESIEHYLEAARLDENLEAIYPNLFRALLDVCDWRNLDAYLARLREKTDSFKNGRWCEFFTPILSLALPFTGDLQKSIAVYHASKISGTVTDRLRKSPKLSRDSKIRIGYISSDFRDHAVAHLSYRLYSLHNREQFEIYGYSYGYDDNSHYRRHIQESCDRFTDIADFSHLDAAKTIARDELDILVDLTGYAGEGRPEILAHRPAPIQVNYLGYPGTMGAEFIDYIISDAVVTPPDHEDFFTEKVLRIDGCFMVTDNEQRISSSPQDRSKYKLPENQFVFCCFCQPYKIDESMFATWMRILKNVPDSVLWLSSGHHEAQSNLRKHAERHSVSSSRLIFAEKVSTKADHLARHSCADLFLDTRFYNGHTTACDALWAGLPVLTFAGTTFSSRVAASLVTNVGLPELVTSSLDEYHETAVELARNPSRLDTIKRSLFADRLRHPLFNTEVFVKNIESLFVHIYDSNCPRRNAR